MTWEYGEDYAKQDQGWTELLDRWAEDGWRLVQAVPDDEENGVQHYRLIFERRRRE